MEEFSLTLRYQSALDRPHRLSVNLDSFVTITLSPELVHTLRSLPPQQEPPYGDVVITNMLPYDLHFQTLKPDRR